MSFACVYTKQIPLENQQLFRWTVNNNITFHFGSMKRKIELSMLSLGMQFTHFNMVFFFSICVRLLFMFYTCCLICYGYSYVSPKNPPKRLHSDVQVCSEFTMAPAAATTMSAATLEEVGLKKNTSKTKEMEWVWKVWVLWCMRSLLFVANAVFCCCSNRWCYRYYCICVLFFR